MKKSSNMIIGVIVVIIVIVGSYALLHKSKSSTTSSTSSTSPTAPAVNNSVLFTKSTQGFPQYLTDKAGNTLYTDGSGQTGVSNCSGSCLASWPPYQDKGSTTGLPTNVSTIKRSDNAETQYTYKGMPLYTFTSDSPGQVTGDGVSNFQVAKP
jgi:predicted lipoprotein with Yx(FWY)xxD motif